MELTADAVFARQEDVILRQVAGEQLLVPIRNNVADLQAIFALTGIGAFVWGLLDGVRTLEAVVAAILDRHDVAGAEAWQDARGFIEQLLEAGLVRRER
jgi:hypothetical protein